MCRAFEGTVTRREHNWLLLVTFPLMRYTITTLLYVSFSSPTTPLYPFSLQFVHTPVELVYLLNPWCKLGQTNWWIIQPPYLDCNLPIQRVNYPFTHQSILSWRGGPECQSRALPSSWREVGGTRWGRGQRQTFKLMSPTNLSAFWWACFQDVIQSFRQPVSQSSSQLVGGNLYDLLNHYFYD